MIGKEEVVGVELSKSLFIIINSFIYILFVNYFNHSKLYYSIYINILRLKLDLFDTLLDERLLSVFHFINKILQ